MRHYDITIIGKGSAGSTLARVLGDKYKILLVDKRLLDKEPSKLIKNCGGLIAPDAQKALAGFGLSIPRDVLVSPQMFSVETIDCDNNFVRNYQRHYINVDRERYDQQQKHEPKRYISIQKWFPNDKNVNQFVAIFDKHVSDFYSWIISKDDGILFGTAIEVER